jgi:hypothetical protein
VAPERAACATLLIVLGVPLVGLTFALPGHGRAGFVAIAVLWALACFALRPSKLPALHPNVGSQFGKAATPGRLRTARSRTQNASMRTPSSGDGDRLF